MGSSGREELSVEAAESPPARDTLFRKYRGCYVSRGVGLLLGVTFVSGMVATGLLVYYLTPHVPPPPPPPSPPLSYQPHTPANATTFTTTTTTTTAASQQVQGTEGVTAAPPSSDRDLLTEDKSEAKQGSPRLPRSLRPLHYLVKLQPLINGNLSILGYVEVEMEVLEATTNITLHIADIITHNDTIRLRPLGKPAGPGLAIAAHQYDAEREFYVAQLKEPLRPGGRYVLSMHFLGLLNDLMKGFYRSTYRDADGTEKRLAATQFQATDARRAFPCFDEPGLKATFEVHLARQDNMTSLSNMPIKETLPMAGQEGWLWDHYQTTVNMSTYLLAFVVSDFVSMNTTVNDNILFRVWTQPSALHQASYSLDIGPRILSYFATFFNQSYPLPKMDMVAIPDFAPGAMENWGLATYREFLMLYDPRVSAANNKQLVASVVAHELAHQWFGNLVSPRWWTDIWLNEGFASYLEYIGVDLVEPSWRILEQFVLKRIHGMFTADSLASSHPIRHNAEHADRVAYDKGSSIIRMMSHFLGDAALRRGLTHYLNHFKYDNAEQDDLWRHLTEAAHAAGTLPPELSVKAIMDTWTLQMGYPVIRVERSPDGTSASVSQERFLLVKDDSAEDTHDYKWWVPLTYTGQQRPDFSQTQPQVWMKDSEAQVTVKGLPPKDQWVIFNLQQTSYYRVNYDQHNWNLLIQQLLNDHSAIHTVNRAQIIDDALDLSRAGQLPYSTALEVTTYLPREAEYVPWAAALDNLGYIRDMLRHTTAYGALRRYLLDIVVPLYDSVGFQDHESDPLLDQYKRQKALSWACELEHSDCLANAAASYAAWMADPDNTSISPNLKSTVYCHAIAEGGEEEWTFAWGQYLAAAVGSEKVKLLQAMGCTKRPWLLSRYLEMAFSPGSDIRKQDALTVFSAVATNDVGRPLAWTFLQDRWDDLRDFLERTGARMVRAVSRNFNTPLHRKELDEFHESHTRQLPQYAQDMAQLLEEVKGNVAWQETRYGEVLAWLEARGHDHMLPSH
ncbi:aminopeptidase N-like [Eriocheir sinensis]|uniref:aminopeptidase N-like n=1 Tax=Eriocheir sinensis TaxID=95602 RepID=UPI0021C6B55E|nr:aminopeptidase N-like [Eriocheir sinensis]XP_050699393.1 aminopeptidase N-like [Eriocheir sinensis]XP_050699394.1 aminopeptidase N-like [Eriocheir sinensis]